MVWRFTGSSWVDDSQATAPTALVNHSIIPITWVTNTGTMPVTISFPLSQTAMEAYGWHSIRPIEVVSPAVLRHWEAERDQRLYERALAEHDDQEAARVLRQIMAREEEEAARRAAMAERERLLDAERARRAGAADRARGLLLEHLTPEQRETFEQNNWFVVEGGRSKTKYRIRGGTFAGNVDVLRKDGKINHRLCAHIDASKVPLGDQLLAQKIMLELAEDDFIRIANRHAA